MNRVIAYSPHDFCLFYIGEIAVASLSCLPEASLLNSLKRGPAESPFRLVYAQTICISSLSIISLAIFMILDNLFSFLQPMRPYYMQIWSVATLSTRLVKTNSATTTKKIFQTILSFSSLTVYPFSLSHLAPGYAARSRHLRWMRFEKGQREPTSKQFETSELRALPRVLWCLVGAHTPLFTPTSGRNRTTSRKAAISANDVWAPLG